MQFLPVYPWIIHGSSIGLMAYEVKPTSKNYIASCS